MTPFRADPYSRGMSDEAAPRPAGRAAVTALIPTFNEQETLPDCLESVRFCDEILVVDSFSTDGTLRIARAARARVLEHEYVNSATQKNWAIPQAMHPWVLVVDADERVTPELRQEIEAVLAGEPGKAAFSIPRVNYFLGREVRHGGWEADRVTRLFQRDRCRYEDRQVHAEVRADGPMGALQSPLLHFTFRSWEQYWPKIQKYSDWGAMQAFKDGQRAGRASILLRPLGRFLKMYVLRLGFLDGTHGAVLSLLAAFSVYLKYAKLWQLGLDGAAASGARGEAPRRTTPAP